MPAAVDIRRFRAPVPATVLRFAARVALLCAAAQAAAAAVHPVSPLITSIELGQIHREDLCGTAVLTYQGAGSYGGEDPASYQLRRQKYRASEVMEHMTVAIATCTPGSGACPDPPGSTDIISDGHLLPFGDTYIYSMRAHYPSGDTSMWSPYAQVVSPACPQPTATIGVTHDGGFHLITTTDHPLPFTRDWIEDRMLAVDPGDGIASLAEYLDEISGGWARTPFAAHIRLGGVVDDWYTIPLTHAALMALYPAGTSPLDAYYQWMLANEPALTASWENDHDPNVYILNTGTAGGFARGPALLVGAESLVAGPTTPFADIQYGTVAHEVLHTWGLRHEPATACSSGALPDPLSEASFVADCSWSQYSNAVNVMSRAGPANHISAYQKMVLGFSGAVSWVNTSDENEPGAYDLTSPGSSVTLDLFDHVRAQSASAPELVIVKLEADDTAYLLDMRSAVGLNTEYHPFSSWEPYPQGVHVGYRLGREGMPASYANGPWQLVGTSLLPIPTVVTPTSDFYDPDRGIRVSLDSDFGYKAVVRIERDPDNCPEVDNPDQADSGGIGTALPDGIGDACQCGDVNEDGIVDDTDTMAFRAHLTGSAFSAEAVSKCNVVAPVRACDLLDTVILRRNLEFPPLDPAIAQACAAATP